MISLYKSTSDCLLDAVGEVAIFGYELQYILPDKTGSISTTMAIKHLNIHKQNSKNLHGQVAKEQDTYFSLAKFPFAVCSTKRSKIERKAFIIWVFSKKIIQGIYHCPCGTDSSSVQSFLPSCISRQNKLVSLEAIIATLLPLTREQIIDP